MDDFEGIFERKTRVVGHGVVDSEFTVLSSVQGLGFGLKTWSKLNQQLRNCNPCSPITDQCALHGNILMVLKEDKPAPSVGKDILYHNL